MTINGTPGDDNFGGTSGEDDFDLSQGGADSVHGFEANDTVAFGAAWGDDRVFGGSGTDAILLAGNYNLTLNDNAMSSVEVLLLNGAFDYQIQFADGNIAAHKQLFISGAGIAAGHQMAIYGFNETNGNFNIQGSAGDDSLYTGAGNDLIFGNDGLDNMYAGFGEDTINGGAGEDYVTFNGDHALDAGDRIDGGDADSINTIFLDGDYSSGLTFGAKTIANIERITLLTHHSYSFKLGNATLPTNFAFVLDGSALDTGDSLHVDGSGATNYDGFHFVGGYGEDVLIGAKGGDLFTGSHGADIMTGNGGLDVYRYTGVEDSTGKNYDTITDFDARDDYVRTEFPPLHQLHEVDPAVAGGKLSLSTFDRNLHRDIGADQLAAYHAVLFTPSSGSLAGELFLVVDCDGVAGYQAEQDLVIHLPNARHMAQFDADNFNPIT